MRITYCTNGHRVEVHEEPAKLVPPGTVYLLHIQPDCDKCYNLVYQVRPFKAKRPGES